MRADCSRRDRDLPALASHHSLVIVEHADGIETQLEARELTVHAITADMTRYR